MMQGEEKNAQKLLRTKQETIDRLNQLSKEDEARYNSKIELLNKQIECAMQKANAQDKAMIQKLTDKLLTKDQENEKSQRIITTLRSVSVPVPSSQHTTHKLTCVRSKSRS